MLPFISKCLNSIIETIFSIHDVAFDLESESSQNESKTLIEDCEQDKLIAFGCNKMKCNELQNKEEIYTEKGTSTSRISKVEIVENVHEISPVFKKYLPESPELTHVNGFEQFYESLVYSDDWDFSCMVRQKSSMLTACKSEPALLSVYDNHVRWTEDFESCSSNSSYQGDFTTMVSGSDTDLLGNIESTPEVVPEKERMFYSEFAERRFGLEWNEKFIETILKEPEETDDIFLILYIQKKQDKEFFLFNYTASDLIVGLLKSFIYPHDKIKICWVQCLAQYIFTWMHNESPVVPLFSTQSFYQPYDAALLLSHSAVFLVRHPDLLFFHNIARVLQIPPKRLLLLQTTVPMAHYNQIT